MQVERIFGWLKNEGVIVPSLGKSPLRLLFSRGVPRRGGREEYFPSFVWRHVDIRERWPDLVPGPVELTPGPSRNGRERQGIQIRISTLYPQSVYVSVGQSGF
jgi:hypothetical protein